MPTMLWLKQRRMLLLWQLIFLITATSWLWAPYLNSNLSYRTALISQYETGGQSFSWLFRSGDIVAGLLVLLMAYVFFKFVSNKVVSWLLLLIGVGMLLDPLLPTTCRSMGNTCIEFISPSFVLHAVETVITAGAFFAIGAYDAWLRKKPASISFVIFQAFYGVLFLSQLANQQRFNTFSQYFYQTILVVWLAWFCGDLLIQKPQLPRKSSTRLIRNITASWAFINGILAILISFSHIHLLGRIKDIYFAGDSAWLAQHGMVIGVIMLYLSRHLARGELRARQIFLVITGIETLKYSVISPNPTLMVLYLVTFCSLFVLRDEFDRGALPLTWQVRLRDLYFMIAALLVAALTALISLDRDDKVVVIVGKTFNNFHQYVTSSNVPVHSRRSVLLAHTISAFLTVSLLSIVWILFRPYKTTSSNEQNSAEIEKLLRHYADSSEDFFKLWPEDKEYFYMSSGDGFVAYKRVGPIAFALADPIAEDKAQLLSEFMLWAKNHRLKVCFLPVYQQNLEHYQRAGLDTFQIGASAVIKIDTFMNDTINDKWWRWQRNRAEKSGYTYAKAMPPHSSEFIDQLKVVSDGWLTKPGREERGFALGSFDSAYLQQCTIYYLRDAQGKMVAFTNQLPAFNQTPTATVDLLRSLPESNNAMPFLLFKTIQEISQDTTYRYFDLGFVPFAKARGPLLAIAKTLSAGRFSSQGLEQFKNKFKPDWHPNYMAYDGDLADLAVIALNLEKAMEQKV